MEYINLKQNKIVGATLPAEWANMRSLKELYIAGAIPLIHWKFGMTSIKDHSADESTNIIVGSLPPEWGEMPSIERIQISFTSSQKDANGDFYGGISGPLPPEWGKMTTVKSLVIGRNVNIEGTLPPEWGNLINLHHLHLNGSQKQNTELTGKLPPEWGGKMDIRV
ncbi:MAG: hypothetical protein U5K69_18865 [Balneolaceae bacterium]|nr:hypothetical protein [Balneolaceae bacterium]